MIQKRKFREILKNLTSSAAYFLTFDPFAIILF